MEGHGFPPPAPPPTTTPLPPTRSQASSRTHSGLWQSVCLCPSPPSSSSSSAAQHCVTVVLPLLGNHVRGNCQSTGKRRAAAGLASRVSSVYKVVVVVEETRLLFASVSLCTVCVCTCCHGARPLESPHTCFPAGLSLCHCFGLAVTARRLSRVVLHQGSGTLKFEYWVEFTFTGVRAAVSRR